MVVICIVFYHGGGARRRGREASGRRTWCEASHSFLRAGKGGALPPILPLRGSPVHLSVYWNDVDHTLRLQMKLPGSVLSDLHELFHWPGRHDSHEEVEHSTIDCSSPSTAAGRVPQTAAGSTKPPNKFAD
jgi:hypothetical protein